MNDKTWLEDVVEDSRKIGIRIWRRKTQDRAEWIAIMRQILAILASDAYDK